MTEQKKPGVEMRRQVMGDVFVDRALGNATEFSQPLQDFVDDALAPDRFVTAKACR